MTYLPEWQRLHLKATAQKWLKQTCTIEQDQIIAGEFGEEVKTTVIIASGTPCRVIQSGSATATSAINEAGAQENIQQEYKLVVTVDVPLAVNQRVTVSGVQYSIIRIETVLTDELFHTAIMIRRN